MANSAQIPVGIIVTADAVQAMESMTGISEAIVRISTVSKESIATTTAIFESFAKSFTTFSQQFDAVLAGVTTTSNAIQGVSASAGTLGTSIALESAGLGSLATEASKAATALKSVNAELAKSNKSLGGIYEGIATELNKITIGINAQLQSIVTDSAAIEEALVKTENRIAFASEKIAINTKGISKSISNITTASSAAASEIGGIGAASIGMGAQVGLSTKLVLDEFAAINAAAAASATAIKGTAGAGFITKDEAAAIGDGLQASVVKARDAATSIVSHIVRIREAFESTLAKLRILDDFFCDKLPKKMESAAKKIEKSIAKIGHTIDATTSLIEAGSAKDVEAITKVAASIKLVSDRMLEIKASARAMSSGVTGAARDAAAAINSLSVESRSARDSLGRIRTNIKMTQVATDNLGVSSVASYTAMGAAAATAGIQASDHIAGINDAAHITKKGVDALTKAIIGAFAISWYAKTADDWNNLQGKIKLVSNSTADYKAKFESLVGIAERSHLPLDGVSKFFITAARSLHESNSVISTITETIVKSVQISDSTIAEANSTLIQMGQALSSNRLGGDEFRSMMENAPRLVKAFTDALHVNVGVLREMSREGALTGDVMKYVLLQAAVEINEEYSKLPLTVGRAMALLSVKTEESIGAFDNATHASNDLALGIQAIANNVSSALSILGGGIFAAALVSGIQAATSNYNQLTESVKRYSAAAESEILANQQHANSVLDAAKQVGDGVKKQYDAMPGVMQGYSDAIDKLQQRHTRLSQAVDQSNKVAGTFLDKCVELNHAKETEITLTEDMVAAEKNATKSYVDSLDVVQARQAKLHKYLEEQAKIQTVKDATIKGKERELFKLDQQEATLKADMAAASTKATQKYSDAIDAVREHQVALTRDISKHEKAINSIAGKEKELNLIRETEANLAEGLTNTHKLQGKTYDEYTQSLQKVRIAQDGVTASQSFATRVGTLLKTSIATLANPMNAFVAAAVAMTAYDIGGRMRDWIPDVVDFAGSLLGAEKASKSAAESIRDFIQTEDEAMQRHIQQTKEKESTFLKDLSDRLHITIGSMEEFNRATANGAIVMDETTHQWERGKTAMIDALSATDKVDAALRQQERTLQTRLNSLKKDNELNERRNQLAVQTASNQLGEAGRLRAEADARNVTIQAKQQEAELEQQIAVISESRLVNMQSQLQSRDKLTEAEKKYSDIKKIQESIARNAGTLANRQSAEEIINQVSQRKALEDKVAAAKADLDALRSRSTELQKYNASARLNAEANRELAEAKVKYRTASANAANADVIALQALKAAKRASSDEDKQIITDFIAEQEQVAKMQRDHAAQAVRQSAATYEAMEKELEQLKADTEEKKRNAEAASLDAKAIEAQSVSTTKNTNDLTQSITSVSQATQDFDHWLSVLGVSASNLSAEQLKNLHKSFDVLKVSVDRASSGSGMKEFNNWTNTVRTSATLLSSDALQNLKDQFIELKFVVDHASHGSGLSEFNDWIDTVNSSVKLLSSSGLPQLTQGFSDTKESVDLVSKSQNLLKDYVDTAGLVQAASNNLQNAMAKERELAAKVIEIRKLGKSSQEEIINAENKHKQSVQDLDAAINAVNEIETVWHGTQQESANMSTVVAQLNEQSKQSIENLTNARRDLTNATNEESEAIGNRESSAIDLEKAQRKMTDALSKYNKAKQDAISLDKQIDEAYAHLIPSITIGTELSIKETAAIVENVKGTYQDEIALRQAINTRETSSKQIGKEISNRLELAHAVGDGLEIIKSEQAAKELSIKSNETEINETQKMIGVYQKRLVEMQRLFAVNSSSSNAEELKSIETQITTYQNKVATLQKLVESETAAAKSSKLAADIYGDQSDQIDKLRGSYQAAKHQVEVYQAQEAEAVKEEDRATEALNKHWSMSIKLADSKGALKQAQDRLDYAYKQEISTYVIMERVKASGIATEQQKAKVIADHETAVKRLDDAERDLASTKKLLEVGEIKYTAETYNQTQGTKELTNATNELNKSQGSGNAVTEQQTQGAVKLTAAKKALEEARKSEREAYKTEMLAFLKELDTKNKAAAAEKEQTQATTEHEKAVKQLHNAESNLAAKQATLAAEEIKYKNESHNQARGAIELAAAKEEVYLAQVKLNRASTAAIETYSKEDGANKKAASSEQERVKAKTEHEQANKKLAAAESDLAAKKRLLEAAEKEYTREIDSQTQGTRKLADSKEYLNKAQVEWNNAFQAELDTAIAAKSIQQDSTATEEQKSKAIQRHEDAVKRLNQAEIDLSIANASQAAASAKDQSATQQQTSETTKLAGAKVTLRNAQKEMDDAYLAEAAALRKVIEVENNGIATNKEKTDAIAGHEQAVKRLNKAETDLANAKRSVDEEEKNSTTATNNQVKGTVHLTNATEALYLAKKELDRANIEDIDTIHTMDQVLKSSTATEEMKAIATRRREEAVQRLQHAEENYRIVKKLAAAGEIELSGQETQSVLTLVQAKKNLEKAGIELNAAKEKEKFLEGELKKVMDDSKSTEDQKTKATQKLNAAIQDLSVAQNKYNDAQKAVTDRENAIKQAEERRVQSLVRYLDALNDVIKAKQRDLSLNEAYASVKQKEDQLVITGIKDLSDEAKARGDVTKAKELDDKASKESLSALENEVQLKKNEVEVTREIVKAIQEKIEVKKKEKLDTTQDDQELQAAQNLLRTKQNDVQASEEAARHARELAKAEQEAAEKAKELADSTSGASEILKFFVKEIDEAITGLATYSKEAAEAARATIYGGGAFGGAKDRLLELANAARSFTGNAADIPFTAKVKELEAAVEQTSHKIQAWDFFARASATDVSRAFGDVIIGVNEVTLAYQQQALEQARIDLANQQMTDSLTELNNQFNDGTISIDEYTKRIQVLQTRYRYLGDEKLKPLTEALQAAIDKTKQLDQSATSAWQSALSAATETLGANNKLEQEMLTWQATKADLDTQIANAQKANDQFALNRLKDALAIQQQVHDKKVQQIQDENALAAATQQMQAELTALNQRYNDGTINLDAYSQGIAGIHTKYSRLGDEQLKPLNDALQAAIDKTKQLDQSATSALQSALSAADETLGTHNKLRLEEMAWDANKLELENQIAAAQAAHDQLALDRLKEALDLQTKIHNKKLQQIQEENAALQQPATTSSQTTNTTTAVTSASASQVATNAAVADSYTQVGTAGVSANSAITTATTTATEATKSMQDSLDALKARFTAGAINAVGYTQQINQLKNQYKDLGSEKLKPLTEALQAVADQTKQVEQTATSTLQTAVSAAAGELSKLEQENQVWAKTQAEIETQITEARRLNDQSAIAQLNQALRLQQQLHDKKVQQIQDEEAAAAAVQKTQADTERMQAGIDALNARFTDGTINVATYTQQVHALQVQYSYLGSDKLKPLNDGLQAAIDKTKQLEQNAASTLQTAVTATTEAAGGISKLEQEKLDWAKTRVEIEAQIAQAEQANDQIALDQLNQALQLQDQLHNKKVQQLQDEAAVTAATQEMQAYLDRLNAQFANGTVSVDDYTQQIENLKVRYHDLGSEKLAPLNTALQSAIDKTNQLRQSATSALQSALSAASQTLGADTKVEQENLAWAETKAELEKQIAAAKDANDKVALSQLYRAMELQEQVHAAKLQQIQEEAQAAYQAQLNPPADNSPTATTTPTPSTTTPAPAPTAAAPTTSTNSNTTTTTAPASSGPTATRENTLGAFLHSSVSKVFQVNFNIGDSKSVPLYGDAEHESLIEQFLWRLAHGKLTAQGI